MMFCDPTQEEKARAKKIFDDYKLCGHQVRGIVVIRPTSATQTDSTYVVHWDEGSSAADCCDDDPYITVNTGK